ncbi:major facilitator superfamily domain-containing protein [Naematelia encephala]|uniref:Major facilitator superfamily domain-containing protein n=1 Tax=Naematelia encephala TaxID=71784 RepID=A0A1Y2B4M2_9TREE|nr:major facilitator superfamily domain-containing protein [Naematelia encephala]
MVDLCNPVGTDKDKVDSFHYRHATPVANAFAEAEAKVEAEQGGAEFKLGQVKKWSLLAVFALGLFVDMWSYSTFFIFTAEISEDLDVAFESQSWVITSYTVTFAAFLLFWGRVADLYSAKPVFVFGFLALGILNLVISFLPDKYSFFILRAVSGIAGATLIPASFRLIAAVFEPHELGKAFTLYGMSGPLASVTGVLVAGFIEYIPLKGQGTAWRWFFRILAAVIIPISIGCLYWIPKPRGAIANVEGKWKRLDIIGAFLMLSAVILLILGLTLGASFGWKKPGFLVPFLLSFVLFPAFFVWEARIPTEYALLPPATWRIPNFTVFIVFALFIYGWWGTNFLPFVEIYVDNHGEKPIIAAVRLLPQALSASAVTVLLTVFPILVSRPRWPIVVGMLGSLTGFALFIGSHTQVGNDYWRYIFPGSIIGSGCTMVLFTATSVGVMTSVPAEVSGMVGAVLQVAFQVGAAVSLSIQAGLLTINPGSISNFKNTQASWYFELGWGILWIIGFLVFYRPSKNAQNDVEEGEKKVVVAH